MANFLFNFKFIYLRQIYNFTKLPRAKLCPWFTGYDFSLSILSLNFGLCSCYLMCIIFNLGFLLRWVFNVTILNLGNEQLRTIPSSNCFRYYRPLNSESEIANLFGY